MAADSPFRRSLAHDEVDSCNYTWVVLLLSLLALVFLLLPLSPAMRNDLRTSHDFTSPSPGPQRGQRRPKVKASCWTPAQFEASQVEYSNEYCTHVANGILQGIKPMTAFAITGDYTSQFFPFSDRPQQMLQQSNSAAEAATAIAQNQVKSHKEREQELRKNDDVLRRIRELVTFRTPLVLFLLALCLKLPHILWTLLSNSMTSGINIDQILLSCVASRNLDAGSQRQIMEEVATATTESVRKSRTTTTSLYLFTKVLTVLIVVAETFLVSQFILSDIHAIEQDLVERLTPPSPSPSPPPPASTSSPYDHSSNSSASTKNSSTPETDGVLFAYPNNIYNCLFTIRQLHNSHDYNVQCVISRVDGEGGARSSEEEPHRSGKVPNAEQPHQARDHKAVILIYNALFTAVLTCLAVLAIADVINTLSWFTRLFVDSHVTSVGLPSNAAKDVVLLVHMARVNAGPIVARGLAGSSVYSSRFEEADNQPVMDTKA